MMFTGPEIVEHLIAMSVTHVIWVPDTVLGQWEDSLVAAPELELVRVCREGEAWPLAAGLMVAGRSPLIMIQTTGLFESGDALRNVVFDMELPIFALIGVRNGLDADSRDSAKLFAEPVLRAWGLSYVSITSKVDRPKLRQHYEACRAERRAGVVLLAE